MLVTAGAALLALGVVPLSAAAMTGLPGASETVDVGRIDEIDCDPTTTELEDIEFLAELEGIPIDEAITRFGWQNCFAEVANYLRRAYSDGYAGAAITENGRGAWIAFRDDVPVEAAELVQAIPVTVHLIGGRGFSEAELDQTLQTVFFDISSHPDVVTASGGYDIETGIVTIQAQPGGTHADPVQRDRLRQVLQPEQPANTAITIEVIIVDNLAIGADELTSQGGGPPAVMQAWSSLPRQPSLPTC